MVSRTLRNAVIVMLLACGVSSVYAQTATPPAAGDGNAANPYQIATLENLYWLSQSPSMWDEHYVQTADIDATPTAVWDGGAGFSPIGNGISEFMNHYNGQGHTISNLTINRPNTDEVGLFGSCWDAYIWNLKLANCSVRGGEGVGGLIGRCSHSSIEDVHLTDSSILGGKSVGGLIGESLHSSAVEYGCVTDCFVEGTGAEVGGLIGYASESDVEDCNSTADVIGAGEAVGGLIGRIIDTNVERCWSADSVHGKYELVGGLIGDDDSSTVTDCYSTAAVSADGERVGGLIGDVDNAATVTDCHSTGDVSGLADQVGGLLGSADCTVIRCYSTSTVSGHGVRVGGLIGDCDDSTVTDSYSTGNVTGEDDQVGGLMGYSGYSNVTGCYSTGDVFGNGQQLVAGLIGYSAQNIVKDCYNTGNISAVGDIVGGLIGTNWLSDVTNCYSTGNVSAKDNVGGLMGACTESTVSLCYSTNSVSGAGSNVGGLMGLVYDCTVSDCFSRAGVSGDNQVGGLIALAWDADIARTYSTGNVSGNARFGGLIGHAVGTSVITDSFWDTQTSLQIAGAGGTGKTTAEMKNVATFTDLTTVGLGNPWDFLANPNDDTANNDYWGINSKANDGYPCFVWTDSDNDGVPDYEDPFPNDPNEWEDTDDDGVGDNGDVFPDDPNEWDDSDGDGVGDNGDVFPFDPNEWDDSDGDGAGDNSDPYPFSPGPVALTVDATDIGDTGATLWGIVLDDFGRTCQCRFMYWKSGDTWISCTPWTGALSQADQFSHILTGLEPNTKYWFWAELINPAMRSAGVYSGVHTFTTLGTPIEVLAPNGGELLFDSGNTFDIQWGADGDIENVDIAYSTDAGATWIPIATVANTEPRTCTWLIPAVDSDQCLLSVTDPATGASNTSDNVFTITTHVVPDVVGMTEADAGAAIASADLAVGAVTYEYSDTLARGNAIRQHPAARTPVPAGSPVDIVVSLGPKAINKPVATTLVASGIATTTATLNGHVIDDGGGVCEYRFACWRSGDAWISFTSWTGYASTGETCSKALTGLVPGSRYYFWMELRNPAGNSGGIRSGVRIFRTLN